jgi:hypothetical protein
MSLPSLKEVEDIESALERVRDLLAETQLPSLKDLEDISTALEGIRDLQTEVQLPDLERLELITKAMEQAVEVGGRWLENQKLLRKVQDEN